MHEFELTARPLLGGYTYSGIDVEIAEPRPRSLVAVAVSDGSKLKRQMSSAFEVTIPAPGKSTVSGDGRLRFLGLQGDLFFILFAGEKADAEQVVSGKLGSAYVTDQSNAWSMLSVSGKRSCAVLQRVCRLDLDPRTFAVGDVARTLMEHLDVIILREDADSFLLMSPASSADSFRHAIEHAAHGSR